MISYFTVHKLSFLVMVTQFINHTCIIYTHLVWHSYQSFVWSFIFGKERFGDTYLYPTSWY